MRPVRWHGMKALLIAAAGGCTLSAPVRTAADVLDAPRAQATAGDKGIILPPATYTVGPEPDCDFSVIQEAIDAASDGDVVRVVNTTNYAGVNLQIVDKALTLAGGFDSCTDATPDPADRSTVSEGGLNPALRVDNAGAQTVTVLVRDFHLRTGNGGAGFGGGVDLTGNVLLRLDRVEIGENQADFGAGVRIRPSAGHVPTLRLEGGTLIGGASAGADGNTAVQQGGGIHCQGGAIEWIDAAIRYNQAQGGAGMYLQGCALTMPAITGGGPLRMVELAGNQAQSTGGGMTVIGGSTVTLSSTPQRLVRIVGNTAHSGAGVLMIGSTFAGEGIHIVDNVAAQSGGGVSVSGSEFSLSRGNPTGANCPFSPRCSLLAGNQAGTNAAAFWASDAQVHLRQTFVESNLSGMSPVGLINSGSDLNMISVQIAGNTTPTGNGSLLFAHAATAQLRNVTVAGNDTVIGVSLNGNASMTIADSILWQPDMDLVAGDGTGSVNASCVNASDDTDFSAQTHAPGFAVGDPAQTPTPLLSLADSSPNLDACDELPAPNPAFDIAGAWRVSDLSAVPNLDGPLDRGAFEKPEPLFRDGFEEP